MYEDQTLEDLIEEDLYYQKRYRKLPIRDKLQMFLEAKCSRVVGNQFNNKSYKPPWWFKLASRIEFRLRRKIMKNRH